MSCALRILVVVFSFPAFLAAEQIPAGTVIEIRLKEAVSTYTTRSGTRIHGLLAAPVRSKDAILLPIGTEISGEVKDVNKVGIGFVHETASLELQFDELRLTGGETIKLMGKVKEVDNAREKVDERGKIHGIRATGTLSHQATGFLSTAFTVDPLMFGYSFISSLGMLRFPESNIYYPAGTDLFYELTQPVEIKAAPPPSVHHIAITAQEQAEFARLIRSLPFRTRTPKGTPSDLTNLVFIGSEEELKRAFQESGWNKAEALNATTTYRTLRSITEVQEYKQAPMSLLLLGDREPDLTYQKTLNTFAKRHHLRVWKLPVTWQGRQVWTSSATHDVDIGFSKKNKNFIHLIDENIDNERAKVANDFTLQGCAGKVDLVQRPWVPLDAKNSTGDRLLTDGRIAVIEVKPCASAVPASGVAAAAAIAARGNLLTRSTRQFLLTTRNDLIRNNLVWQGVSGVRALLKKGRNQKPAERPVRSIDVDNDVFVEQNAEVFEVMNTGSLRPRGASAGPAPSRERQPSKLELSLSAGLSRLPGRHVSDLFVLDLNEDPPAAYDLPMDSGSGLNLSSRVTFNTSRFFSQEVFFSTSFQDLVLGEEDATSGRFRVAMLGHNLLANFRPNGARLRPYVAVGPALVAFTVGDTVANRKSSTYRFGLQKVSIIRGGFSAAGRKPLEGGVVYKLGLNYGAGIKIRLTNLLQLRLDLRETFVPQPDLFSASALDFFELSSIFPIQDISRRLRHHSVSLGISITF